MTNENISKGKIYKNQILIKRCTNKLCDMVEIPYIAKRFDYFGDEVGKSIDLQACRSCGFKLAEEYQTPKNTKGKLK